MIMPSQMDIENREIYLLFQPIILERNDGQEVESFKIRLEAGIDSGARSRLEYCEKNRVYTKKHINFPSVDSAVVEVGRLPHNKLRQGFRNCPAC